MDEGKDTLLAAAVALTRRRAIEQIAKAAIPRISTKTLRADGIRGKVKVEDVVHRSAEPIHEVIGRPSWSTGACFVWCVILALRRSARGIVGIGEWAGRWGHACFDWLRCGLRL